MARLPEPGKDNGTWGNILNDYLSQAHDTDGSLKDNSVTSNTLAPNSVTNAAIASDAVNATSIADGSITETLLDNAVQTKLNATGDWSTLSNKPAVIGAGADAAAARNVLGLDATYASLLDVGITFRQFGAIGNGIADDTAAVQAAVTAAKAARRPIFDFGGTYKVTTTIDARCTVSGANQADDFKGIIGAGRQATQFVMHTNNIPIFRFSGRYFTVKGFTAKYATMQTVAHTNGNVFDLEDWIYFATFTDLLIENGYVGWNSKDGERTGVGSGLFSNGFSDIRLLNNRYVPLRISATGGESVGGTGNAWSNIYISNPGVDRIYRAIERIGGFEDVFNQLNIEQSCIEDCAFFDTGGDSLIVNGLHYEGNRMMCGSGQRAIVVTNGKGRSRIDIGIDESSFGAHKVSGITRSSITATATIDLLDKPLGGHGLRVGDTIVVDGANEGEYNGTFTVTAVPSTTTVQYTVSGSPATPATLASGIDYITVALGAALGSAGIQVVKARSGAEIIEVDVRIRDVRLTGKNATTRATVFRLAAAEDLSARVKLRNLSTRGQIANAHLPQALDIVALSRTSNVATAYTRLPHRLRAGELVFVVTAVTGFQLARQVVAVTGPHSFTYNSTGSDAALTRATSSALLMKTVGTTHRSRSGNVATLTLDATHSLVVGMRVRVANISGYTGTDVVISAVTATTISYVNTGSDEGTAADTGGVVMALDAGISLQYLTEPNSALILEEADWLYSGCEALNLGTINAGTAATQTTTHYGVRVGDRIEWTPMAAVPDGLQLQAAATAADTITWRAYNPTGSNLVSGVNLLRYRLARS